MDAVMIGWPQAIMIGLSAVTAGMTLAKHGQSRGDWSFGEFLFNSAIAYGLLIWGGFFS